MKTLRVFLILLCCINFIHFSFASKCVGDVTLTSQAQVNAFSGCDSIIGNLNISGGSIVNLNALSNLKFISGDLVIDSTSLDNTSSLSNLKVVEGKVFVSYNNLLQNINLNSLGSIGLMLSIGPNPLLNLIEFNSLQRLAYLMDDTSPDNALSISFCPSLVEINTFKRLKFFRGSIIISSNNNIETVNAFDSLQFIGVLHLSEDKLKTLNCCSLTDTINQLNIESVELSNLNTFQHVRISEVIRIYRCSKLKEVDGLGSLLKVKTFICEDNAQLASLNLPSLSNLDHLNIVNMDSLKMLDNLGSISKVKSFYIEKNDNLKVINFDHLRAISESISLRDNPQLTDLNGFKKLRYVGGVVILDNQILNSCCILAELQSVGRLQGVINIANNGPDCSDFFELIDTHCSDYDFDNAIAADNCMMKYNPDQMDTDNDGIGDACDNCPEVANFNQVDANNDGIGDACASSAGAVGATVRILNTDMYLQNSNRGIIIKSSNGYCFRVRVDNFGNLFSTQIVCP
jgi:hypothetical protein